MDNTMVCNKEDITDTNSITTTRYSITSGSVTIVLLTFSNLDFLSGNQNIKLQVYANNRMFFNYNINYSFIIILHKLLEEFIKDTNG